MLTTNMEAIGGTLPNVLGRQTQEEKGELARLSTFIGAVAIADLVKSTLGPKGMVSNFFNFRIKSFSL
jgi:T-complex protein 1 subunit beta